MTKAETRRRHASSGGGTRLNVLVFVFLITAVWIGARVYAVCSTNRGTKLCDEGKFAAAITEYEKALKVYPGFEPAAERLRETYMEEGDRLALLNKNPEAEKVYQQAIALGVEELDVFWKLATVCWRQGDNDGVRAALEEHRKRHPKDHRTANFERAMTRGQSDLHLEVRRKGGWQPKAAPRRRARKPRRPRPKKP